MKKKFAFVAVITIAVGILSPMNIVHATAGVWSPSGSTIYYNDGNVGIGTSSPILPLQIMNSSTGIGLMSVGNGRGSFEISGNSFSDGNGYNNISTNAYWNGSNWQRRENNKETWIQGNFVTGNNSGSYIVSHADAGTGVITNLKQFFNINSIGDPSFSRAVGSNLTIQTPPSDVRLYTSGKPLILASGNVGIGTTNPQRMLSVNGTILAKEILVSTAASYWPDYVFDQDYKLMSITDLQNYIKTNKHLPNTPSAEELEKQGLSLGEMQRLQMEKIEELTLYAIQQDKKISDLEARLEKLEKLLGV